MQQPPPGYGPPPQGYAQPQTPGMQAPQPQYGLVPAGQSGLAQGPWSHMEYTIKRPFWSFLGRKFHVYAPDGSLVLFVKHPLFKLKQEFVMYTDESEKQPLLTIRARNIIGFNIAHDVFDAYTNQKVGTIRTRGLKSILRDTWDVLDPNDQAVGLVQEDGAALLRRFFPILTGKWHVELGGQKVAGIRQVFRFFTKEFKLDLSMNSGRMDPRFAIGCAIMALMAESRREAAS